MHPDLQGHAFRRLGVFTAREARQAGYDPEQISSAVRSGQWHALRRGIYIESARWSSVVADDRARHLVECVAVLAALGPGPVLSHTSAARLHRLLVPRRVGETVRLTDVAQWRRGRGYLVARAGLPADDVLRFRALSATTPARTLVDCAREWRLTDAVVAIDGAIQTRKVTRSQLQDAVLAGSHRVGIGDAARAVHLADGRAESPLETRARLALLIEGLPLPELQVEIYDEQGLVGRVDAWYEEAAVAVEIDGKIKYLEPRDGRTPAEVAWEEKRREDALRELGIRVLRLVDEDVVRFRRELAPRLRRFLAAPFLGPRRFRAVRTEEPGAEQSQAA
jgi:predicted transcriptional regulator of viral defense system